MSPAPRRAAPVAAQPVAEGVNFGSLSFYAGGFTLPKGKYAMEFNVIMHNPVNSTTGQPIGKPRLGVMVTAHPLAGGEPMEQFFGMGSKADQSFAPDPTTGKGVVAVPGGPASTMNNKTNWSLFLKSLYDCGLPEGIFTNDFSTIDGVWVQTDLVPEPEDRKGFGQAKTGEAAAEQEEKRQGSGLIPVIVEILDGGKPWEGTGGIPEAGAAVAGPAVAKPGPKAVAKTTAKVAAPVAPAAPVTETTDDDAMTAAVNGVTTVLEANPNGVSKLLLRTGTFKAVSAAAGAEMAQSVIDTYFASDDLLNSVLGQLGYGVSGNQIKPV